MRKLKNIKNQILFFYEKYGLWATIKKCIIRLFSKDSFVERSKRYYNYWLKENVPTQEELEEQRKHKFKNEPKISIVVPMYNTPEEYFKDIITCMKEQTYSNWELCLADGSEEENHELDKYYKDDERIKYRHLDKNDGISGNTNEGLKLVTGDYVGLLDHDDVLPRECLFEVVKCINENPDVEFIYTDEDKLLDTWETKNRHDPHFKPDFSPDTLSSNNYITHFVVMTKELMIDKLKGFRKEYNGAQDFDLVLRASEETDKIVHISKVLYHWRVHDGSTAKVADSKPWAYEAGKLASQHHLDRLGLKATVDHSNDIPGVYKVQYEVIGNPKVCIIIPNKDSVNLLKTCVNSILEKTIYDNYEIDIVENNSEKDETFEYYKELEKNPKIKILYYQDKGFNYSKIINFGVKNTESDFVLQLNNDTELLTPDWLEHFIGFAQQKRIGCVGARLMYKDKSIQHAGIAYGVCGLAANLMPGVPWGMHGYYGREALLRNVSAVTGACLFCRRELYEEVGYMDENDFAVAFNDVDFCLKIAQKGYLNIYNPYIMLMHYESKSRGDDDRNKKRIERFKNESEKFRAKWHDLLEKPDPYYNINFSKRTAMFDIRTDKVNCTTDYDYDTERYLTRKKKHEKRK